VVISLGSAEIAALIADPGEAVVTCEFCRSEHRFSRPELERLLAEMQA